MDLQRARADIVGAYITVPTMFRDPDLELVARAVREDLGDLRAFAAQAAAWLVPAA